MMSFSSDQLAVLQKALAQPMPDMEPPPHMSCSAPPTQPAPADVPSKPPPKKPQEGQKSLPLLPLTAAYLAVAASTAVVSLARPDKTVDSALLASPLLCVALSVHALALPAGMLPQRALAFACALTYPAALWVGHPAGMWAACACLSLFFPSSMPPGILRVAAAAGFAAVVAAGGLLLAIPAPMGAHSRAAWALILVALCIQSVLSTGRLRGQRLRVVVSDPPAVFCDSRPFCFAT